MSDKGRNLLYDRRIALIIFVFLFIAVSSLSLLISSDNQNDDDYCAQFEEVSTDINWIIESTIGIDVDLGWQRSLLTSNPNFAVGSGQLLFYQGLTNCHEQSQIVAFDVNAGEVQWSYDARIVRGINTIDDGGYIVSMCCTELVRLSASDDEVWRSEMIPARILRPNVYISDDLVYFPTNSQIHVLNIDDGREELALDLENALAIYDDYALLNPVGSSLNVVEIDSMDVIWSARLPAENTLSNYDVFRFEDVVVVAFGRSEMTAYNIENGEELWTFDNNLQSFPIFVEQWVIVYGQDNTLTWHDIFTGNMVAEVVLTRIAPPSENLNTEISIPQVLSADEEHIFIYHDDTRELIALSYRIPE